MSPLAPPRICTYPGCGAVTHGSRCPRHQRAEQKQLDQRRGSSSSRGYGGRWQKARASYLRSHPLCLSCEAEGHLVSATHVDHLVPHRGDQRLFWDEANWQPLCAACHNRKTATEDGGFGR